MLDIINKEKIRNLIKKINHEEKTTVILTTHDISDVRAPCNKIIVVDKGSKLFEGSLDKVRVLSQTITIDTVFEKPSELFS